LRTGKRTGQRLIEVMVRAHEPRDNDAAARVDDAIGIARKFGRRSECFDGAVAHEDRRVAQDGVRIVEGLDVRRIPNQQRCHTSGFR
jgi:hypothetical protein